MKLFSRIAGASLLIILLGTAGYGLTHTRDILDYLALRGYSPSSVVIQLADATSMDNETRRIFYVNRPELQDKQEFKNSCTQHEQTIVLGCFVENQGIFLLDIQDDRLKGILEVTAAHEVLHALYERLDEDEKARVDKLTDENYRKITDKRIIENVENYRTKDASVVPNELHSILATEVRNLTPELENYYSQYFFDRKVVVGLSEKYEQTFVELENKTKSLEATLNQLKESLDRNETQLDTLGKEIDSEKNRLDGLARAGRDQEYNAGVDGFNALVARYNQLVRSRQALINQYNQAVGEYNSVATTEADLYNSLKSDASTIDSRPAN